MTAAGERALHQLIEARRDQLRTLLDDWSPDTDDELAAALDRLARALVAEIPADA